MDIIAFKSVAALEESLFHCLAPARVGLRQSSSVMKYLGRRSLAGTRPDEVISDYRRRHEGIHR